MSDDNQYTLDIGFEIIRKCLAREQKNIFNQLEKMLNPDTVKLKEPHRTYKRHGIKTKKNDYRDYYWIKVITKSSTYWITLFYNDVDKTSGNFHTQIGRIQFWKGIDTTANSIGSPNRKDSAGNWSLCLENAGDPKMRIDSPNYNVTELVNLFISFLEDNNESNIRKN